MVALMFQMPYSIGKSLSVIGKEAGWVTETVSMSWGRENSLPVSRIDLRPSELNFIKICSVDVQNPEFQ